MKAFGLNDKKVTSINLQRSLFTIVAEEEIEDGIQGS